MKKRIAVLTGAGISAESGISTFRDANGLWEGHDVMEVASPEGFMKNPELVLEFYNQRRRQLLTVNPNDGHRELVRLESKFEVDIITQNVDDLHERAGSMNIIHLHGELLKARPKDRYDAIVWKKDITLTDCDDRGVQLRPHIVWFGEAVPLLENAIKLVEKADMIIIIGTSMQVYPAASLVSYARHHVPVYYIDPKPSISYELQQRINLEIIAERATIGVPLIVSKLLN